MSENNANRGTLYKDDNVILRRYQTGRYGLTIHGLRVIFSTVHTPPTTSFHEFRNKKGKRVGSIRRSQVPHKVTLILDEIEQSEDSPKR